MDRSKFLCYVQQPALVGGISHGIVNQVYKLFLDALLKMYNEPVTLYLGYINKISVQFLNIIAFRNTQKHWFNELLMFLPDGRRCRSVFSDEFV